MIRIIRKKRAAPRKTLKKRNVRKWTRTPTMPPGLTNAKVVLEWVVTQVIKEQRRLSMFTWVAMLRGKKKTYVSTPPPACGTVACLAGWVNIGARQPAYDYTQALHLLGIKPGGLRQSLVNLFLSDSLPPDLAIRQLQEIIECHAGELAALPVTIPSRVSQADKVGAE